MWQLSLNHLRKLCAEIPIPDVVGKANDVRRWTLFKGGTKFFWELKDPSLDTVP